MRVVLDTNILVSGTGWPTAPPGKILDAWVAQIFNVVISKEIFEEYRRVLMDFATRYPGVDIDPLLESIVSKALWVSPEPMAGPVCRDPNDDMFIAAALAGKAKYIVSGDKALLYIQSFRTTEILTPAQFISVIQH